MHFRIELDEDVTLIQPVGNFEGGPECEAMQNLVTELTATGCRKVGFCCSLSRWIN